MVAAVSKLMRNQDLISVAAKVKIVLRSRSTIGLSGTLATRRQPNNPTDDPRGTLASTLEGLSYGCGDAVIGVNPAQLSYEAPTWHGSCVEKLAMSPASDSTMFDLKVVRYFVCVARSKSFSRAAVALNVAQPAISRQIKHLETVLGVDLLHRTTRRLELTAAGEVFLARGEALLAQVEAMTSDVLAQGSDANPSGTVTIGVPPSCTQMLGPRILAIAMDRYPNIRLRIVEGLTLVQEEWLLSGRVDLAVVSDGSTRSGLTLSRLFDEEFVFLCRERDVAGTEMSHGELVDRDLILTKAFRESVERQIGKRLYCSMEIDSLPALYRMIMSGGQGTILPASLLQDEHLMGRLAARPIAGHPVRRLSLARDHKQSASLAVRAIHALLLASISERASGGDIVPKALLDQTCEPIVA